MRTPRISLVVVFTGLIACQDAGAPTAPGRVADAAFSRSATADAVAGDWVFRFERMVGNDVTGSRGMIRNRNAIGAPWRVERGEARLSGRGELRVKIEGLVLQSTGLNPITAFRAILSCLTNDDSSTPVTLETVDLMTGTVAAGLDGDFEIRELLSGIPAPCYAPIVFVTNASGSWAAISGF